MTIFSVAKTQSEVRVSKKKKIDNVVKCDEFVDQLKAYVTASTRIKALEREKEELAESIMCEARKLFMKKYAEVGVFPGTIKLASGDCEVSLITQDKYKKVSEGMADYLESKYGIKCESNTSYTFNPELLQKYENEISRLIEESKIISDEDKVSLIVAKTDNIVPDGTIKRVSDKNRVPQFITDVGVVHYLKV